MPLNLTWADDEKRNRLPPPGTTLLSLATKETHTIHTLAAGGPRPLSQHGQTRTVDNQGQKDVYQHED